MKEEVRAPTLAKSALDKMDDTSQKDNNFMKTVRELYCELSPDKIKEWLGITTPGALRNLFEFVGANDQCKKSGIVFVSGETTCWLCGCVLYENDKKACEHIVPALRAALFSGLVVTREIMSRLLSYGGVNLELFEKVTKNNYLWACETCNGSSVKGGIVCFTLSSDNKTFIPDIDKCLLLANKIWVIQGEKMKTCNKNFKEQVHRHIIRTGKQNGGAKTLSMSKRKSIPFEDEYDRIIKGLLDKQQQFVDNYGKTAQKHEFKNKKINPKVLEICAWLIAEYSFILEAVNREFKVFLDEYEKLGVSNEQVLNCAHQAFLTYIFSLFRLYLKNAEFNLAKKEKKEELERKLQEEIEKQQNKVIEAKKNLIEACQVITSWNNRQVVVSEQHSTEICDGIALEFFKKFFSKDELPSVDINLFSKLVLSSILRAMDKDEVVTSVFTAAMECALPFVMQALGLDYRKDLFESLLPSINDDYSKDYVDRLRERYRAEMENFNKGVLLKLALYRLFHELCKNSYSDSDSEHGFTPENIKKVTLQTNKFFDFLISDLFSHEFAGLILKKRMPREVQIKHKMERLLDEAKRKTLPEAAENYQALLMNWDALGPTTPKSATVSSPLSRTSSSSIGSPLSRASSSSSIGSHFSRASTASFQDLNEVSAALGLSTPLSMGSSKKPSFADVNHCQGDDGHFCERMSELYHVIDIAEPVELADIIEQTTTNNIYGPELTPHEEGVIAKISAQNNNVSDELRYTLSGQVPTEDLHTKRKINHITPSHTYPPNDDDDHNVRYPHSTHSKKPRGNPSHSHSHSPSSISSRGGRRVIKTKKNTKRKSYNFYKSYRKNGLHKTKSNKMRKTSKIHY